MLIQVNLTDEEGERMDATRKRDAEGISRPAWVKLTLMKAVRESEERQAKDER
jgi:hypothetical protein